MFIFTLPMVEGECQPEQLPLLTFFQIFSNITTTDYWAVTQLLELKAESLVECPPKVMYQSSKVTYQLSMIVMVTYQSCTKVKSCYNPLRLGTAIVLISSGIDFVNTPRLYNDWATRWERLPIWPYGLCQRESNKLCPRRGSNLRTSAWPTNALTRWANVTPRPVHWARPLYQPVQFNLISF